MEIASDYGVLMDDGIAARGVFIIDNKGILQSYTVNNLGAGRNVDEILRTIAAYHALIVNPEIIHTSEFRAIRDLFPGRYPIWRFLSKVKRLLGFPSRRI